MLSLFLTLFVPAQAAEVQVATAVPINVLVDGVPIRWDENSGLGVSPNLPAGPHVVESRNLMGKTTAYKEITLAHDDQIRFEYRKRELWHIGTYKMAVAPLPLAPPMIPGATTVVVVESAPPVLMAPGIGVVISDGHDAVAIDVGVMGTGLMVGESTTTTTTVVTTNGPGYPVAVVNPAPMAPTGMNPSSFGALLRQMDDASFSDDKLSLLQTAVVNNWLNCSQLSQLLGTLSFGSDQVKAVGIARPAIVDPENAHVLNDRFSFSSDAQKAQTFFR